MPGLPSSASVWPSKPTPKVFWQLTKPERELKQRLEQARALLPQVQVGEDEMALAVRLALALKTEGHRADLTTIRAACTVAALEGRTAVTLADVKRSAGPGLSPSAGQPAG